MTNWSPEQITALIAQLKADELPGDRQRHREARIVLRRLLDDAAAALAATQIQPQAEPEPVIGYMCKVDWDFEIGNASGAAGVYASEADLRSHRKCVANCGVVEVEVRLRRVVQEGTSLAEQGQSDDKQPPHD